MRRKYYMVKETVVAVFLVLLLIASLINIHYLTKLTHSVATLVDEAAQLAAAEEWGGAEAKAEAAAERWESSDTYTHLVLRHSELESATDALFGFLQAVYAKEKGNAKGAAAAAKARMMSISSIETIKLGSIF